MNFSIILRKLNFDRDIKKLDPWVLVYTLEPENHSLSIVYDIFCPEICSWKFPIIHHHKYQREIVLDYKLVENLLG